MFRSYGVGGSTNDSGEAHAEVMGRLHKADESKHPCVFGFGRSSETNPALLLMFDLFFAGDVGWATARGGYPTYAGDFQNNSWGNDGAIGSINQGLNWFRDTYGLAAESVYLVGGSMGFLSVCNWARCDSVFLQDGVSQNLEIVKAIAGVCPAINMDSVHDRNYLGYAAEIEAAYGGAGGYAAALPTHDPALYASELVDTPIKLWYSTDDPAVLPADVLSFAEDAEAEVQSMGDQGHSYFGLDLTEIVEFFDEHP